LEGYVAARFAAAEAKKAAREAKKAARKAKAEAKKAGRKVAAEAKKVDRKAAAEAKKAAVVKKRPASSGLRVPEPTVVPAGDVDSAAPTIVGPAVLRAPPQPIENPMVVPLPFLSLPTPLPAAERAEDIKRAKAARDAKRQAGGEVVESTTASLVDVEKAASIPLCSFLSWPTPLPAAERAEDIKRAKAARDAKRQAGGEVVESTTASLVGEEKAASIPLCSFLSWPTPLPAAERAKAAREDSKRAEAARDAKRQAGGVVAESTTASLVDV
jgi:colicin import membrane protein